MATSITNTSVTTDNLTVDTDTIHVDSANNRVGIGTTSPNNALEIAHTGSVGAGGLRIGDPSTIASDTGIYLRTTGDAVIGAAGGNIVFDTNMAVQEDMRIDSSGRITTPNQPSFMVYGAWSYAASTNVWKGFATIDHNIGSHWNNTTGRFTAPIAGRYMIYAAAHHSAVGSYHLWAFLKNGTAGGGNWVQSYDANGGNDTTSKTQVWNLAAGDYLEVASNGTYANGYTGGYVTVGGFLVG